MFSYGLWRQNVDDLTLLAGTVSLALLGNAFICGVISGPHDRYGARLAWVATFVVLIAAARYLSTRTSENKSFPSWEEIGEALGTE